MDKVIRDGKVAVLVSPGFGAGWSTWADREHRDAALFHPAFVAMVEDGSVKDVEQVAESVFGANAHFYCGGVRDLRIEWLPQGTVFTVHEYDGSESIEVLDTNDDHWVAA